MDMKEFIKTMNHSVSFDYVEDAETFCKTHNLDLPNNPDKKLMIYKFEHDKMDAIVYLIAPLEEVLKMFPREICEKLMVVDSNE